MVTVDLETGVVSRLTEPDLVVVVAVAVVVVVLVMVAGLPALDAGVLLRLPTAQGELIQNLQ